jgi:hypothetical protein
MEIAFDISDKPFEIRYNDDMFSDMAVYDVFLGQDEEYYGLRKGTCRLCAWRWSSWCKIVLENQYSGKWNN